LLWLLGLLLVHETKGSLLLLGRRLWCWLAWTRKQIKEIVSTSICALIWSCSLCACSLILLLRSYRCYCSIEGSWSFWSHHEASTYCSGCRYRCYFTGLTLFLLFLFSFLLLLFCLLLELLLQLFLLSLYIRIVTISIGVKAACWIFIRFIQLCYLFGILFLLFFSWRGISCLRSSIWIISSVSAELIFIVVTKFINVLTSKSTIFASCSGSWASRRCHHILCRIWRHASLNSTEFFSCLLCKFSFILKLARVLEKINEAFRFVTEFCTLFHISLHKCKILEISNFVQVILEVLNDTWSSVLDKVVHDMHGLGDSLPFFTLKCELLPQMLHNNLVILPVVSVICQNLQFGIRYIPRVFGCALHEDGTVLNLDVHLVLYLVCSFVYGV